MTEKFDPLKIKVGNYIAYNRKINGISQEEFASLIGVSSRALSKIENGYNYPSLNAASKINEYLNISIINLMNEDDSNPNLRLNILYNKLIYSLENREYHNIKVIVLSMDDLIDKISRTSIYYKKYLFSKAWGFIIDNKLNEANDSLEEAFKLNFVKSQEDKSLNVRI